MRASGRRRAAIRTTRLEQMEPRLLTAADTAADFAIDYLVGNPPSSDAPAALATAAQLTGLDTARAAYGFTGAGQTVAIIDSGIAYTHSALGGGYGANYRVVGGYDFAERDANPYDDGPFGSHGTHVAGIVGSSDATALGLAPSVDLVALRVFDDQGTGDFQWVEQALQWVHQNRNAFDNPITTVNLSLGANWNSVSLPSWAMLEDEFAQLELDGIFIAAAAGNSFATYNTTGLSYPAASSYVVPVASVDANGLLSSYSQRSDRVIAAPGRSILSTVPDYAGDYDGADNDFAAYSGTSMAAPFVAGASVILREAYEFVGIHNVTEDMLYNVMRTTADTVYDTITGQNYCRLNLDRALDAIMPQDDFGSTAAAAFGLGALTDTLSLAGTIGRLDDNDWFTFKAAASGTVHFSADATGELAAQWQLASGIHANFEPDGTVSFDVIAGQSYSIGLGTQAGIGHYTLEVDLDATVPYTDWGTVAQATFADTRIDAAGQWFAVTAANNGILTVEALLGPGQQNVSLRLLDGNHRPIAGSQLSAAGDRIDVAASAGDTFFLYASTNGGPAQQMDFRITNLVAQNGAAVQVLGTAGNDAFSFAAGSLQRVTINGVAYSFNSSQVTSVQFDGRGGQDTATLLGGAGADTAVLQVGAARLSGAGYLVTTSHTENNIVRGGSGQNTVTFYDSAGNDAFRASPGDATLSGKGFLSQAQGFQAVVAYATAGGADTATLVGSRGDDLFVATPQYGELSGNGFSQRAEGFRSVYAYAVAGEHDTARLYDSAGNDVFLATPDYGKLYGDGFLLRAKGFDVVNAYSTSGGLDRARLYGSSGADTFLAGPDYGRLYGAAFDNQANGFATVRADSQGGDDTAHLYDSAGNDVFVGTPTYGRLYGSGFNVVASLFRYVNAYAYAGGHDVATLYDSAGDDAFVATSTYGKLSGATFTNTAKLFDAVHADTTAGGSDQATLYDSDGSDSFKASGALASLLSQAATVEVYGFEQVRAYACRGGTDTSEVKAVDYLLQLLGNWDV